MHSASEEGPMKDDSDCEYKPSELTNQLLAATEEGDAEGVGCPLSQGVQPETAGEEGSTSLHLVHSPISTTSFHRQASEIDDTGSRAWK